MHSTLERNIDVKKLGDNADIFSIKKKILYRQDASRRISQTKEEETWKLST
jgi:hypothetical protein